MPASPILLWLVGAIVAAVLVGDLITSMPTDRAPEKPRDAVESVEAE